MGTTPATIPITMITAKVASSRAVDLLQWDNAKKIEEATVDAKASDNFLWGRAAAVEVVKSRAADTEDLRR
jgi:hypothetical protein